jgi:peptide/nickel transport system permease protein
MTEAMFSNPAGSAPPGEELAAVAATPVARRARSFVAEAWRRDRNACVWFAVFVLVLAIVVIGPFFLQSSSLVNPAIRLETASPAHLLGTDELGRDILSREVAAGRVSLGLGAVVTAISVAVGLAVGLLAGFYQRADGPVMRVVDALLAFPPLVLAIALVVFLGNGAGSEIMALSIIYTPYLARIARASTVSLRERVYVLAARSSGQSGPRILLSHILPNSLPTILVQASFVYASVLLSDAALSFLGLGVAAPTPTWGNMVAEARPYISNDPLFIVYPGVAIVIVVMALNLIGDAIRDLLDPRTRALVELEQLRGRSRRLLARSAAAATAAIGPAAIRSAAAGPATSPTSEEDNSRER